MEGFIKYTAGYKYQLNEFVAIQTKLRPATRVAVSDFLYLFPDGELRIEAGYAWDGPSGPTIDTPSFMRGSLVHDALYQLLRQGELSPVDRLAADQELWRICREDDMSRIWARLVYWGVRLFGSRAASTKNRRRVLTAPHSKRLVNDGMKKNDGG